MKRFFHLALLIGALFGFLGQSAAIAMLPTCAVMMEQPVKVMPMAAGTMDCCPDAASGKSHWTPSKDEMPNCLAMTGCFVPLTLGDTSAFAPAPTMNTVAAHWPLVIQLSSRSVQPEQRPPSI